MIRKTFLVCILSLCATIIALNACTTVAQTNVKDTSNSGYMANGSNESIWEADLTDKSRFTLNLKLSTNEQRLAKKFSRTVQKNLTDNKVYVHYLFTKLKEENLPLELAAIPLIESGLNPHVHYKGAHGAWQFVRSTGKTLGLHNTGSYDGLYDFFACTDAGVKYLKYLYSELKNWELVVAAYNQGEYGVKKAISRAKKSGVKHITADNTPINAMARNYVHKFRAFSDILKNPDKYQIDLPNIKNRSSFKKVEIAGQIKSLNEVARLSGASIKELKKLNSGYTTDKIDSMHGLLVPIEHADQLEKALYSKRQQQK